MPDLENARFTKGPIAKSDNNKNNLNFYRAMSFTGTKLVSSICKIKIKRYYILKVLS